MICDFSGYATRNDLLCGDGRTIRKDAFRDNDGQTVPLIYNHDHNNPDAVLGHALLENREDGVYAYCTFNDTENGQNMKTAVQHGDVRSLSIYANKLKQIGGDVIHGSIRELSLVLAGANPGAYIDFVMAHGEDSDEIDGFEACYDEYITIHHSDIESEISDAGSEEPKNQNEEAKEPMTREEILATLTEDQVNAVMDLFDEEIENLGNEEEEDDENMRHNVFDGDTETNALAHSEFQSTVIGDAKRLGSMKDSFLEHADEYGITNVDYLFPDAKPVNGVVPEFIKREDSWVKGVMSGVKHSPFSRIKSVFADITEEEARAKGYIKGNMKKDEVFSLLKRTTTPTTIYKKQKMDRDDINDITGFEVIAWIKGEMRMMLDEEIARAILVGDGRLSSSDDKINETCIRPIYNDADLFTIKTQVTVASTATADDKAKAVIKAAVKAKKNYRGSGNTTFYTTEDTLTDMLLLEDTQGYRLYKTEAELAAAMRVSKIVTVPVMENRTGAKSGTLIGIIVNLADYTVGADNGGSINMFDDFDIDYNQQKYLIETRCSGALTKPYSAIALEFDVQS